MRRVGLVLIAIGIIDIGVMIYCIANKIGYSSSFNIFSLLAGIFLWRGHLGAAKFLTSASAFFFAGFLTAVLLLPFFFPIKLLVLYFQESPIQIVLTVVLMGAVVYVMYWVYGQLRSSSVLEARGAAGHSTYKPNLAFGIGAGIPVLVVTLLLFTRFGETGKMVVSKAENIVGEGYEYHIQSFKSSGSTGRATVVAYNESEYKKVKVSW